MPDHASTTLPVAESYDQLQSIPQIEELTRLAEAYTSTPHKTSCILKSCLDILFLNIKDLVQKNLVTIKTAGRSRDLQIARRQIWVRELLDGSSRILMATLGEHVQSAAEEQDASTVVAEGAEAACG